MFNPAGYVFVRLMFCHRRPWHKYVCSVDKQDVKLHHAASQTISGSADRQNYQYKCLDSPIPVDTSLFGVSVADKTVTTPPIWARVHSFGGPCEEYPCGQHITDVGGLNIFYSSIACTEKDWVRLKVRHYPLHSCRCLVSWLSIDCALLMSPIIFVTHVTVLQSTNGGYISRFIVFR